MTEPTWLERRDALALHERLVARFGGTSGIRDLSLLDSALARPKHLHIYDAKADLFDLAAAYASGVIRGHPFVDGNKRTGFVLATLFLDLNGEQFAASEEAAARIVLDFAAGQIADDGLAAFLRESCESASRSTGCA